MDEYKFTLDVCERMIDRLQRELYSNGSIMGGVNSSYECMSDTEKQTYSKKRKQLNNLLKYRTEILNCALIEMNNVGVGGKTLDVVEDFTFED